MPGACRRGRPRTAWMDNIKTWTGISVEESVRMTGINGEKVRPWCGQPSARGRLKNRTEQNSGIRRRAIAGRPPSPSRLHPNFLRFNAVRAVLLCDVSHPAFDLARRRGAQPRFQSPEVQFLGLGYYCPSPQKIEKGIPSLAQSVTPPDPHPKLRKSWGSKSNSVSV